MYGGGEGDGKGRVCVKVVRGSDRVSRSEGEMAFELVG